MQMRAQKRYADAGLSDTHREKPEEISCGKILLIHSQVTSGCRRFLMGGFAGWNVCRGCRHWDLLSSPGYYTILQADILASMAAFSASFDSSPEITMQVA